MITFEEAVATLDDDGRKLATELHTRALDIGYIPFVDRAGKKEGNYKIEYKADKNAYVLFISRISKGALCLGCKLLHLGEYTQLICGLREVVRDELLKSRRCKVDEGCTAFIKFEYEGTEYLTCRHAMRLKTLAYCDAESFWELLAAEASHRNVVLRSLKLRQERA